MRFGMYEFVVVQIRKNRYHPFPEPSLSSTVTIKDITKITRKVKGIAGALEGATDEED